MAELTGLVATLSTSLEVYPHLLVAFAGETFNSVGTEVAPQRFHTNTGAAAHAYVDGRITSFSRSDRRWFSSSCSNDNGVLIIFILSGDESQVSTVSLIAVKHPRSKSLLVKISSYSKKSFPKVLIRFLKQFG